MPGHIESFGDKKTRIAKEIKKLGKEIDEFKTAEHIDPVAPALTPAQEAAKLQKLNAKVLEIKTRLEQDVLRWKQELGSENVSAMENIDSFWTEMQQKIEDIDKTDIGKLLDGLDSLKQKVEAAEVNTAAPDEDTIAEGIDEANIKPTVKDIIVEVAEEDKKGLAGMIGKLSKLARPLMKIITSLMIELKKMGLNLNPFASEAEKEQIREEIVRMQEAHESTFGMDDLRDLFTAQAKKLGFEKLIFKPGLSDSKAVVEFRRKFEAYRGVDPSRTKEKYVQELLREYVQGDAVVSEADLATNDHLITLKGFMEGKKPQVVA
ncbi:MAG: hypothetical protein ABIA92_01220 [Patescibacteria group bacterium]